jgi:hypothetical protein
MDEILLDYWTIFFDIREWIAEEKYSYSTISGEPSKVVSDIKTNIEIIGKDRKFPLSPSFC